MLISCDPQDWLYNFIALSPSMAAPLKQEMCVHCERLFALPKDVTNHCKGGHKELKLKVPCAAQCGNLFDCENSMKAHMNIHSNITRKKGIARRRRRRSKEDVRM